MNWQESIWHGIFGNQYTERCNPSPKDRSIFLSYILNKFKDINSICEIGSNRGNNLSAFHSICPTLQLAAVEINIEAYQYIPSFVDKFNCRFLDFKPLRHYDLVLSSGFLIHINPDDLMATYSKLIEISNKYILLIEYFSKDPIKVAYRGYNDLLFVRDFASEMISQQSVKLLDCGFLSRPVWDNVHWWIMEK